MLLFNGTGNLKRLFCFFSYGLSIISFNCLGDLLKLLDVSSVDNTLLTTYGKLQPPLGKHRLKVNILMVLSSCPCSLLRIEFFLHKSSCMIGLFVMEHY